MNIEELEERFFKRGFSEGFTLGARETSKQIAKDLLVIGLNIEDIIKVTGVSKEFLENFK